jgi:lysozyme
MANFRSRLKQGTVAGAILCTTLSGFEGIRLTAYPDPATHGKPWAICMGKTQGVHPGMRATLAECIRQLYDTVPEYVRPLEVCVRVPVPDKRLIAITSLAWNIGPGKVCGLKGRKQPSVADLLNAGKIRQACDAFLRYDRAAGIYFPGLHSRRVKERALCLEPTGPSNPVE